MEGKPVMYGEQAREVNELFAALAKAQAAMGNAPRVKDGPHGKYADLATVMNVCRKALGDNGLCVIQSVLPFGANGETCVATTLGHTSGQWIRSCIPMESGLSPQRLGESVTYARRIALSAMLGIAADDEDDGQSAEANHGSAVAANNHQTTLMEKARKKLLEAKGPKQIQTILGQVEALVEQGDLTPAQHKALCSEFAEVANAQ